MKQICRYDFSSGKLCGRVSTAFNMWLLFFTMFPFLLTYSESKILQGRLVTRENWAFLARFCFLTEEGTFRYNFELGGKEKNLKILLYYDAPDQWTSIYPSNKTCIEKEAILWDGIGQIIPLSNLTSEESGCVVKEDARMRCASFRRFRSEIGLNVSYWVSLTNAPHGYFWKEHFSVDEFYILPELITIACIYVVLVILSIYVAMQLRARRLLHVSYKIFVASLLCQLVGMLFEIYSYINLGLRGVPSEGASLLGQLLEACSDILYTVLMLLLALGFTVTKSILTAKQIKWLTVKKMSTKLHFYGSLFSLGSAWFLCHPLTILCITLLVDEWVRESVAKGCSLWIIFMGHIIFLYITRPSMANKRFPFHIRTCQVMPIGGDGQDHSYEPHIRTTTSAFTISHLTPATLQS
ncbi:Transmembrane protein 145 [Habropoda laboriosa]|uniref:Transmembrane protein 145 n=1 Tax=Habropoda laboriosa TaxID=597456 RepID=A0A0L7QYR8_9HYME|nr:Transmembrane protein 145 [Habropoda laboriosa]